MKELRLSEEIKPMKQAILHLLMLTSSIDYNSLILLDIVELYRFIEKSIMA